MKFAQKVEYNTEDNNDEEVVNGSAGDSDDGDVDNHLNEAIVGSDDDSDDQPMNDEFNGEEQVLRHFFENNSMF